ncbi:MAG: S8 family peptidase [Flavisolibacter sp.]
MHLLKSTAIATLFFVLASCQKEDATPKVQEEEICSVRRGSVDGNIIEGQYIVAYNQTNEVIKLKSTAEVNRKVLTRNRISTSATKRIFEGKVAGFVARLSDEEVEALKEDPAVAIVEPDRIIALSTCFTVVAPTLVTWNVNKVGYGDGIGKTAWVIDTGIDMDHPDLNVDATRSKSFLTSNTSPDDENGHGTHVAGIIGAKNNNIGMLGVASGATLVSLRVLDKDGNGTLSAMIQALSYVNANAKAGDVVNMSLGEEGVSEILDQHVQTTSSKGILISIAAGNDGKAANLFSPGRANGTNIYTVSAVDSLDNFASFSNFGNDVVDYAAPGVRIISTYKEGKYAKMSGTSMAAPHVTGLLLLNGSKLNFSTSALNDPDGSPDKIALK